MRVRALRRLSECEVRGLGIALERLERTEALLVETLPRLREGAAREAASRRARHLPDDTGPAVRTWSAARLVLHDVSGALEDLSVVERVGKVEKRAKR